MTPPSRLIRRLLFIAHACIIPCCFAICFAQTLFKYNFNVEDGLPSSETYDIIQDSKGLIWIATDRGVARYDGYKIRTFNTENGLTDNTVFNIYEDHSGRIWFLTFNGRLCYFKNDTIWPFRYNNILSDIPKPKIFRSFAVLNDTINIGFLYEGVMQIFPNGTFKRTFYPDSAHFLFAQELMNGLVLSTHGPNIPSNKKNPYKLNVFSFKGKKNDIRITYLRQYKTTTLRGLKRKNDSYIFYIPGKLIEVSTSGEIKETDFQQNEVYAIFEDKDSCLWIALKSQGVFQYGPNSSCSVKFINHYFNGTSVSGICEDSERGLWFSTLDNGIYYVPSGKIRVVEEDQNKNAITICGNGKDEILIQYKDGTSALLRIKHGQISHSQITGKNTALYFSIFKNNEYWCGGNSGIDYITNGKVRHYPSPVCRNLTINSQHDTIWYLSTHELILSFLKKPGFPIETFFLPARADAIFLDSKNNLWVGTQNGLYLFEMVTKTFTKPFNDVLLDSRITEIKENNSGDLLLATIGKGIIILKNNTLIQLSSKQGLHSNIINGIALDKDIIWAATNKGVSRISFINGNYQISNFTKHNGLPTHEINKVYVDSAFLWLASGKGAIQILKSALYANKTSPSIFINKVSDHNNNLISYADGKLDLPYNYGQIKIEFLGIALKQMGEVLYKYKLNGLTETWQYSSAPFVQFTSLDPGNYSFEVYAQNENGIWSNIPAKLEITVMKPFWSTWWFIALVSAAGALIIGLFIRWRLRQQQHKSKMLETINNLHLHALASQMNPHFIFNSLTSIQAFVLKEDNLNASVYLSRFSKLMRMELENIRKQFVSVESEAELLEHYLKLEQLRFNSLFEYELSIDDRINRESTLIPTMMIQPYVENSIKHGIQDLETKGIIRISISLNHNVLVCSVEDNGIGREASRKSKPLNNKNTHESAGMNVTEQRLKLLCESMQISYFHKITDITTADGKSAGTIVQFILPCKFQQPK